MIRTEEIGIAPSDQALLDPGGIFESPEAVLARQDLADREKIEILRRWEYDASEACVALEEGMPGPEADLLRRILLALDSLGCSVDLDQVGRRNSTASRVPLSGPARAGDNRATPAR